ncbi:site-specific DNA-methyltransferase [Nocardioides sp. Y6]|uniref:Site-specific DNA-methyltransferase n=2 Tax=Nocardioides malaquae TaxID=2773426 RepID=A0ABR9RSM3_9ACTN|nr:site-specific DNA-methyltransferase [Nocardioides malaquae]
MTSDLDRRVTELKDLLPEAFTDGEFDPAKAAEVLGIATTGEREHYGLRWAGKQEAQASLQVGSVATLRPNLAKSIDYDTARNLVIEGDNLEVLRLLQRGYNDKVKLIYIDPPYNTGNTNWLYNDDFSDGLIAYLEATGQVAEDGNRKSSKTEAAGRRHSGWLSMMYPRLALARNLLAQDGVIFVSIDDNEVHNLRHLMDEVFGPENFVGTVIWQKVYSPKSSARHFSEDHDYLVVYARNANEWTPNLLPRTAEMDAAYKNPDNDPRGPWKSGDLSARNFYSKGTYPITCPSGRVIDGPPKGNYWRVSEESFREMDADGRIWWGTDGNATPSVKRFLSEVKQGRVPQTLWTYKEVGHNQDAKKQLLERVTFETSDSVFDTPKPTGLIRRMLTLATSPDGDDIVLDFFAGSGSTADGVLQANAEDGGNRRFISVQFPEPTGHSDYGTVADITRTRVAAAIEATQNTGNAATCPAGTFEFRYLELAASNFKVWDSSTAPTSEPELAEALALYSSNLAADADDHAIVAEVVLKEGATLDLPWRDVSLAGERTVLVGNKLAICLARNVTTELTDALVDLGVPRVVMLDAAFTDKDQAKSNAFYRLKNADITMRTV